MGATAGCTCVARWLGASTMCTTLASPKSPKLSRKSSGVPTTTTTSAPESAARRALANASGCSGGSEPRPMPLVKTGTCSASAASRSAATASPAYTSEPAMMTGRCAAAMSIAARPTSSGSGTTGSTPVTAGISTSATEKTVSSGKSRKAGPRCGVSAACSAAPTARGMSSVLKTVSACLVTGATSGRWSISWRLPEPQRNAGARPPSTSTGEALKKALVMPEMPLVTPGPAVSTARPGRRCSLATASAAKTADCSCLTS